MPFFISTFRIIDWRYWLLAFMLRRAHWPRHFHFTFIPLRMLALINIIQSH